MQLIHYIGVRCQSEICMACGKILLVEHFIRLYIVRIYFSYYVGVFSYNNIFQLGVIFL